MKRFSFGKDKRLINGKQFKAVLDRNLRVSNALLTLYMAENDCGYPRLGISIKKSCGNAVVRNRLKRLMREAFRQSQDRIPAGFDYLLMISPPPCFLACRLDSRRETRRQAKARRGIQQPTFEQVKASFLALVNDGASRTKNSKLKTQN